MLTMLTPLLIGDVLRAVGVPGSIALVAVALLAVHHLRSGRQTFATIGFAAQIIAVVGVVLVAAAVGLIPGVSLEVAWNTFGGWLITVWEFVATGIRVTLDSLLQADSGVAA